MTKELTKEEAEEALNKLSEENFKACGKALNTLLEKYGFELAIHQTIKLVKKQ